MSEGIFGDKNNPGLNDISRRRYMRTLKEFFEVCETDPKLALALILENAQDKDGSPYPARMAMAFLFGLLQGTLSCKVGRNPSETLKQILHSHKDMAHLSPADFLGSRRKPFARGSGI